MAAEKFGRGSQESRVPILLPIGRDAELVARALESAAIPSMICDDFGEFREALSAGCGPAVIAEEALSESRCDELATLIEEQPKWSDLPIVVFSDGDGLPRAAARLSARRNTSVLRRPIDVRGFLALMKAAVESRRRQHEVRDLLEDLRNLNVKLEGRAEQLQRLALEMTQAEERERRRLASILHDDLQQVLAYSKLQAGRLRRESEHAQETADEVIGSISDAIELSRSLSHELSPPLLHTHGLAAALRWLAGEMERRYGLKVDAELDEINLGEDERLAVLAYQAARELLFNATKHAQTEQVRLALEGCEHALKLTVADEGAGFDATSWAEAGGDEEHFGLFSIAERANHLDGSLEIDSEPGTGSRFVLSLPTAHATTERAGVDEPATAPTDLDVEVGEKVRIGTDHPVRVMLVDDHRMLRQALAASLAEQHGIQVVGEAGDGDEALELAAELRPDVVLMDVSMPGKGGVEATRELRAAMPQVRVIGLSMHDAPATRDSMLSAGAEAYLTKDGPLEGLVEAIRPD